MSPETHAVRRVPQRVMAGIPREGGFEGIGDSGDVAMGQN